MINARGAQIVIVNRRTRPSRDDAAPLLGVGVAEVTSPSFSAPEAATILKTEPGSYMSATATLRMLPSSSFGTLL